MTDDEIERLANLARGATKGPWKFDDGRENLKASDRTVIWIDADDCMRIDDWDAAFIEEACPDNVLALIAKIRALQVAVRKSWRDADWCDTCESHPSRGHDDDCPAV